MSLLAYMIIGVLALATFIFALATFSEGCLLIGDIIKEKKDKKHLTTRVKRV